MDSFQGANTKYWITPVTSSNMIYILISSSLIIPFLDE